MIIANVPSYWHGIVTGTVLVSAVSMDYLLDKLPRSTSRL